MINIFIFTLVAILLLSICIFWQQIKQQKKFQPKAKLDKSLDQQLLTMLGGDWASPTLRDRKAALRLLRTARKNNPGRTYLWYHEKVIRDLLRDRRC